MYLLAVEARKLRERGGRYSYHVSWENTLRPTRSAEYWLESHSRRWADMLDLP